MRMLVLLAAGASYACGGGGDSSTAGIDRGGVRTPAIVSGTISGFGSVIVRGTHFATDTAAIYVDNALGTEADLGVGQVVSVTRDNIVSGTPTTTAIIDLDRDVIGPIDSVDSNDALVVLGQTVRVDATTGFSATIPTRSLEGLESGDVVAISGFYAADGSLLAGRIEPAATSVEWRVHGFVTALDTAATRFRINELDVDYGTAMIEGFPSGAPSNGDFVVVRGRAGAGDSLRASLVNRQGREPFYPRTVPTLAVLEGLVTRFNDTSDFEIDGQRALATAATTVQNGTLGDLGVDVRLVAAGTLSTAGTLSIETLTFVPSATVQLQAPVSAISAATGTLTVLGTTVRVLPDTFVEDLTGGRRVFTLADLAVGDWLTLSGYADPADGTRLIATRLARDNDDDDDIEIVGPVRTLADPEFTILGTRILTSPSTEFDDIDRDAFFAGPAGIIVEVEGTLSGNVVIATEVEAED